MGCCESNSDHGELNLLGNLTIASQAEYQRMKNDEGFDDISLSSPAEFEEYKNWVNDKSNLFKIGTDTSPSTSRSTCVSFHRTENELAFLITTFAKKSTNVQIQELTKCNSSVI